MNTAQKNVGAVILSSLLALAPLQSAEAKRRLSWSTPRRAPSTHRHDSTTAALNTAFLWADLVRLSTLDASRLSAMAKTSHDTAMREYLAAGKLLRPEHPTYQRVARIAERLLRAAGQDTSGWQVDVVNDRAVNAYCLPGGKIVIFTGIIDLLQLSDDEIAAVMGHEIAHVLEEHALKRIRYGLAQSASISAAGAVLGRDMTWVRLGSELPRLKFSRDNETEADSRGIHLARAAWYDACAAPGLWKKMAEKSGARVWEVISTHPDPLARGEKLRREEGCE